MNFKRIFFLIFLNRKYHEQDDDGIKHAMIIAHFAEAIKPKIRDFPNEEAQALEAAVTRRKQISDMITAEKNRKYSAHLSMKKKIQHNRHVCTSLTWPFVRLVR